MAPSKSRAVRDLAKPLGTAEFRHLEEPPPQLQGTLLTIEQIEAELAKSETWER